jgi:HEAT repeat protein
MKAIPMTCDCVETRVLQSVEDLRGPEWENAYHALLDIGVEGIPPIGRALHAESDVNVRRTLVRVLWQTRSERVLPWLVESLRDSRPEIWKEALDGLVAIGSEDALNHLENAKRSMEPAKVAWFNEAISQIVSRRANPRS